MKRGVTVDYVTYLEICFQGSGEAISAADFTPVAMNRLGDRCAIQCYHLNVIRVEYPAIHNV